MKAINWFELTEEELFQMDLTDSADQLWEEIAVESDKNRRSGLIRIYNKVANECNRVFGREYIVIITSSTKVISAKDSEEEVEIKAAEKGKTAIKPSEIGSPVPKPVKVALPTLSKKIPGGKSIIEQILDLYKEGLSNKEIIEKGYNKSTVNRQVAEYKKRKANGQEN